MNGKNKIKKAAALLLGLALTVGAVGCGNFVVTDSQKDLAQTVATVNIAKGLKTDEDYKSVAGDVEKVVKKLSTDVSKRDLVAYFLSTGYQYVESYGYTYEDTFNMLMDSLVSREIMIQYAIAYYLKSNPDVTVAGCEAYIEAQLAAASERERELLKANPEVLTLKYFLTEGGKAEKAEDYDRTVYSLKKSLNDSLDSLETSYINALDEEHDHGEARTLPTGVNTEKEDYYFKDSETEKYNVYTGRNTLDSCKGYEKQEGSTTITRQKAYNAFLSNLQGYNMIGKDENTSDINLINYYYVELSSLLGQALINKYFETLEAKVSEELTAERVAAKYEEIKTAQKNKYENAPAAFETALDSVSDTSFLLYGLKDFGFVYNILLPFSTSQNVEYTTAKNNGSNSQDDLYKIRRSILTNVKGEDLRGSWISAHEHANYSYEESENVYKFFKDQTTGAANAKYDELKQYAGSYAYNGSVDKTDADDWKATPNKVDIDQFISIMENHINTTVGNSAVVAKGDKVSAYAEENIVYTDDKEEVDYSKFVYYKGSVSGLGNATADEYFYAESDMYKAVSAVNELMFAYSTDTGCLNKYYGYAVSPYGTDFVKEFEYAAQEAVRGGAGTYVVCATDYGWHIVFASFVFGADGDVYSGYNHADAVGDAKKEGSFSNLFYESLKASAVQSGSTEAQNTVLNKYNNDDSVTLFKSRYQDLLNLKN